MPSGVDPTRSRRRQAPDVDVHPVRAVQARRTATWDDGARQVRRPLLRHPERVRPEFQDVGDRPPGDHAARSGTDLRPDRRQHLPGFDDRYQLFRSARCAGYATTARRSTGCTCAAPPPIPAAASWASPATTPPARFWASAGYARRSRQPRPHRRLLLSWRGAGDAVREKGRRAHRVPDRRRGQPARHRARLHVVQPCRGSVGPARLRALPEPPRLVQQAGLVRQVRDRLVRSDPVPGSYPRSRTGWTTCPRSWMPSASSVP